MTPNKRIIIAISGASGAIYAERLLKYFLENSYHIDLIISKYAQYMLQTELGIEPSQTIIDFLKFKYPKTHQGTVKQHALNNLAATLSSGTRCRSPMIVIPCSMKTLSGIANGYSANLIERSADVTLKENNPLIIVPRETPLSLIHLENMIKVKKAGAHVVAAMPAFYQQPKDFNELADFIVSRILNLLGIDHQLVAHWEEPK